MSPRPLAGAFRSSDSAGAEPVAYGLAGAVRGSGDERMFGVIGSESLDVSARIVEGRAPHSGCHVDDNTGHRKFAKGVDVRNLRGHNKYMSTSRDFAAEYFTACIEDRTPGATLAQRAAAQRKMERIFKASDYSIPVYEIDEAARLSLYPSA